MYKSHVSTCNKNVFYLFYGTYPWISGKSVGIINKCFVLLNYSSKNIVKFMVLVAHIFLFLIQDEWKNLDLINALNVNIFMFYTDNQRYYKNCFIMLL